VLSCHRTHVWDSIKLQMDAQSSHFSIFSIPRLDLNSEPSRILQYYSRFRGGLVFKAHRLLYHSNLGLRVIKKKKIRFVHLKTIRIENTISVVSVEL